MDLSVVVPVFNEKDNLALLYEELLPTLEGMGRAWEVLFIDDGSGDGSREVMDELARRDTRVRVIRFRRNFGQTAALMAGFRAARGKVIVAMDADLQNEPADIPLLLAKMDEGYDLVSGWRKKRKDKFLTRILPSIIANRLINKLIYATGVQLHDYGCTLKVYKADIIKQVRIYGEMHRFIPAFAGWLGVKVAEVEVNHRPRSFGYAKYNLSRVSRVIFDLIVIRFFADYMTRPIQFFGKLAWRVGEIAILLFLLLLGLRLWTGIGLPIEALLILLAVFMLAMLQLLSIGLLGEIMMRSYFEGQDKDGYVIEQVING